MSKTLSVLIVENFVINEGPKWEKFKKGVKKVGQGAVAAAAIGSIALTGAGGARLSDANKNYDTDMAKSHIQHQSKYNDMKSKREMDIKNIDSDKNTTPETKQSLKSQIEKDFDRDWQTQYTAHLNKREEIADRWEKGHTQGKQALAGAAGLLAVPLVAGAHAAGAEGEKKKQAKKSLKERLNLVKSGMSLNEEDADTTVLEKERYSDGHTPESIATLHNVPVQYILDQIERGIKVEREHTTDKDEARLIAMDHLVELPDYYTRLDKMEEEGKKDLEEVVEDVPVEENIHTIADAIEESFLIPKSLKIKYHNSRIKANTKKLIKAKNAAKEGKAAAKIEAHSRKHARNKFDEKWADSFEAYLREVQEKLTEFEKVNSDELDGKLKKTSATQEENRAKSDNETLTTKESLKERLNLVKSGMLLNEESADITALRNKINQGLILLPGLKGAAADRMEDSIRGWEDQINELKKK